MGRAWSHRNRGQLAISREALCSIMEELAEELKIIVDMGTTGNGGCGHYDMEKELDRDPHRHGYLFWGEGKDHVFEHGGDLYLHHGHRIPDETTERWQADKICAALKKRRVTFSWDGNLESCIRVPVLAEPGYDARKEAEWRQDMLDNGMDPDDPDGAIAERAWLEEMSDPDSDPDSDDTSMDTDA